MFPTYDDPIEDRIARFTFSPDLAEKILKAERCFIVGTGPGLAKINLDALADEFVIGVNFAMRAGCKPDIVCMSDPSRLDTESLGPGGPKVVTVKHLYNRHMEFLDQCDTYHDIQFVDAGPKTRNAGNTPLDPEFGKIFWAASVIAELCVPLATYLGIKDVYVLGLDGARASYPSTYVGGSAEKVAGPAATTLFHLHECIAQQVREKGARVYNASPGGVVEAFQKVDLHDVKPDAVRKNPVPDIDGKYIVLRGALYRLAVEDGVARLIDRSGTKYLRHKNSRIVSEKDDGTDQFRDESSWIAEPSFVDRDWVCFRSKNVANHYMVSPDGIGGFRLWPCSAVFSPYFSSFRIFDTPQQADSRIETDKIHLAVDQIKGLLGSLMVRNDRASL